MSAAPSETQPAHFRSLEVALIALCHRLEEQAAQALPEKTVLKVTQTTARTIATVLRSFRDLEALKKAVTDEKEKNDHPNPAETLESAPDPVKSLTRAERRRAEREAKKAARRLKKNLGTSLMNSSVMSGPAGDGPTIESVTKDIAKAQGLLTARQVETS